MSALQAERRGLIPRVSTKIEGKFNDNATPQWKSLASAVSDLVGQSLKDYK